MERFQNRTEAGRLLAKRLQSDLPPSDAPRCVLALPRGGLPVARQVALAFHAPLDILVVRKLGVPWQPELAFGAIASGEIEILNTEMLQEFAISPERVDAIVQHERAELWRREQLYRGTRPPLSVNGQSVIVVDDGIATGATMLAAVEALRHSHPAEIIVAVPVAPPQTCQMLRIQVERVVCLLEPTYFDAVGSWYAEFPQVSDDEVRAILAEAELESHMRG